MKHSEYFKKTIPCLLDKLTLDHKPKFGLMTPQHMLEHLIWVTKATAKDKGPAPEELTKSQQGFMSFIDKGAIFKYRPSDKTEEDLPPLKYASFEEAKQNVPTAIERLSSFLEDRSSNVFNPMMGDLTPDGLATFHFMHYKWHLEEQYGLSVED